MGKFQTACFVNLASFYIFFRPQVWGNEKLEKAEEQILENKWDLEAWAILVREAQNRNISDMRPFFEKLVSVFPTSGRYWKLYIEMELRGSKSLDKIEQLFQRCLIKVLYIDLWKLYLIYVKETKSGLVNFREKMAQAYDFAIDKIGMDILSYGIWNDYILFLKSVDAQGSYAENQKIIAIRKVYQRAVVTPMINIELLWKDYIAYEQGINPIIAEKMMIDRSKDYMTARRVTKELEIIVRGLNKNYPSIPPTGSAEEMKQAEHWRKYIVWEKSNPLNSEDTSLITKRVMFAFEQCLLSMGYHPDFWYEAAQFLDSSAKILTEKGDVSAATLFTDEASSVYERAITTTMKESMLLHFAYADFEENLLKWDKVHQIYSNFLDQKHVDPSLAYIQYMKFARRAEGIKSARAVFKKAREDSRCKYQVYVAAALMEYYCSKDKNIAFRIFELGLKHFSNCSDYVLSYIDYMSHLNEDNNTRVLFERVLSSGRLEPRHTVEIWNKFLEFESNVGDLPSILKVEQRRSIVLEKLADFEGKGTAQIIDRYRFQDLYPCSATDLKCIGYNASLKTKSASIATPSSTVIERADDTDQTVDKIPRPDFSQMIPYKPKPKNHFSERIPGGTYLPPPAVGHLLTLLPPPNCFSGPFVSVDSLFGLFNKITVSDNVLKGHQDANIFDVVVSARWDNDSGKSRRKRPTAVLADSDNEDDSTAPAQTLFRMRQQDKRKHKKITHIER